MYRKALIPVDGSELATTALVEAAKVLGSDGEALIVQVVDSVAHILARTTPAGFELNVSGDVVDVVIKTQREAATKHLAAARDGLQKAGIARVETRIVEGEPGPTLVKLAGSAGCDIVIMATHGRSGLKRAVLGSVADHVIRNLRGVPVLLVHPDEAAADQSRAASAAASR